MVVAEGVRARRGELLLGVDDLDGALLELDRVAAGGDSHGDEALGEIDVAVVVDADFRDDIAGLAGAKLLASYFYGAHSYSIEGSRQPGDGFGKPRRCSSGCHRFLQKGRVTV